MNALCNAVRLALAQSPLPSVQARLLCAVSGGADSTALLHSLSRVCRGAGFSLTALHVQHHLRGENSLEDERFVRALCQELGINLIVENAQLCGTMDDPGMETLARSERLRLFEKHMAGYDALLLAHHRDDQTETVLMHLMRGSGMSGLCGMRPCIPFAGGYLIRPFLGFSKQQILSALASENLPHRDDESNFDPITPRNAIRLSLLPAMERLYPGAGAHIAQAAQLLQADEDYLTQEASRLFETAFYGRDPLCMLLAEPLKAAHPALVRRVLRFTFTLAAGQLEERALSMQDTLALERLVHAPAGETCNLPAQLVAVRGARHIHLSRTGPETSAEEPMPLAVGSAAYRFRHCQVLQEAAPAAGAIPSSAREVILTPEILALCPVLRIPRPDDVIRPLGAPGAKPLRRFFTDRKVDPFFRYQLPVLAHGQDVLWAPGLCVAEALRLSAVPAGSIRLTLHLPVPFQPHQSKE